MLWVIAGIFFVIYLLYESVTEYSKKNIEENKELDDIEIRILKRKEKIEKAKREAEKAIKELTDKGLAHKEIKDKEIKEDTELINSFFENLKKNNKKLDGNISNNSEILVSQPTIKSSFDEVIENRGITHLCHFTNVQNLDSIMEYGLISVDDAEDMNIFFIKNDCIRLDGKLDGISLSVTFPNSKMFYKYRTLSKSHWAVILLDTSIINLKKCAFYKMNAADHRMREIPLEELQGIEAFKSMFDRFSKDSCLPEKYTTNEQAEIMVFEKIEKKFIKKIIFNNRNKMNEFLSKYKDVIDFDVELDGANGYGYFSSRDYVINKERNVWH